MTPTAYLPSPSPLHLSAHTQLGADPWGQPGETVSRETYCKKIKYRFCSIPKVLNRLTIPGHAVMQPYAQFERDESLRSSDRSDQIELSSTHFTGHNRPGITPYICW